jgi:hypothetical protein
MNELEMILRKYKANIFYMSPSNAICLDIDGEKPLVLKQGFKESQLLGLAKKSLKELKKAFEPLDYPDGAII